MEQAVEKIEKQVLTPPTLKRFAASPKSFPQMQKADAKLDSLAIQVGNIENNVFSEDPGAQVEVFSLLRSVGEVKTNYQNLRKEILEVQDLQKELSSTVQAQLKVMQNKCNLLKERISARAPAGRSPPSHQGEDQY